MKFRTPIALLAALACLTLACAAAGSPTDPAPEGLRKATFAGGCFWCMEPPFDVCRA